MPSTSSPAVPHHPSGRSRGRRLRLGAGLAVAALGLSALTACSSAVSQQGAGADAGPQSGGVLRIGAVNDIVPATFFTNSSDTVNTMNGNVFDTLVDYPADSLEAEPSLATEWEIAEDGRSITLQLRDDVTFHDGRELTSEDVKFSVETWADPKWSVQLQRTAAAVTDFDTSDPHAITLGFDRPLGNILDLLDILPILDSATLDQLEQGEAFVGTGPFEFVSWTPGDKVVLERNDDYWGEEPYLDGIEIDVIADPQAQVAQLRSGQVDLVTGASSRDLESLESDDRFDLTGFEGAEESVYVGADLTNPALESVELRRAIAYALDRDRIVEEVYRGFGTPASTPWPQSSPAFDEEANATYFRDVDRAQQLADDAGDVGTLPLAYPAGIANYEATAQIVQANLEEIGIETELQPTEFTDFIDKLIAGDFGGLWILQHNYAQFSPGTLAVSAYPFNADKNASHYDDADYKEAAEAAWAVSDPTSPEAAEAYDQLTQRFLDGAFLLEIASLTGQVATEGVQDVDYTKRRELVLDRTYLTDPEG